MRFLVLAGAIVVASTSMTRTSAAQSLPNISGIKQTTNRAVAKTNAHTLAMTNVDSAGNAAGGAKAPAPNGSSASARRAVESPADTGKAHGVRATAAGAATRPSAEMDTAGKVVLRREVFSYEQSGRRDLRRGQDERAGEGDVCDETH